MNPDRGGMREVKGGRGAENGSLASGLAHWLILRLNCKRKSSLGAVQSSGSDCEVNLPDPVSALPLSGWIILGKLLHLTVPQFPCLKNGNGNTTCLKWVSEG